MIHRVDLRLREQCLSRERWRYDLLIEEHFGVLLTGQHRVFDPTHTERIGLRPLKKSAVPPKSIGHAVLCSPMKFCPVVSALENIDVALLPCLPSEANTMGLSGLEGSVRQKTSARPSEAS